MLGEVYIPAVEGNSPTLQVSKKMLRKNPRLEQYANTKTVYSSM